MPTSANVINVLSYTGGCMGVRGSNLTVVSAALCAVNNSKVFVT